MFLRSPIAVLSNVVNDKHDDMSMILTYVSVIPLNYDYLYLSRQVMES